MRPLLAGSEDHTGCQDSNLANALPIVLSLALNPEGGSSLPKVFPSPFPAGQAWTFHFERLPTGGHSRLAHFGQPACFFFFSFLFIIYKYLLRSQLYFPLPW